MQDVVSQTDHVRRERGTGGGSLLSSRFFCAPQLLQQSKSMVFNAIGCTGNQRACKDLGRDCCLGREVAWNQFVQGPRENGTVIHDTVFFFSQDVGRPSQELLKSE